MIQPIRHVWLVVWLAGLLPAQADQEINPAKYGLPLSPRQKIKFRAGAPTNQPPEWRSMNAFLVAHGTNTPMPLEVLYNELESALQRRERIEADIERETRGERNLHADIAATTAELEGPRGLLKMAAGMKAQSLGIPRFAMGDLRWYATPTVSDYCKSDTRWIAANQQVILCQQRILARRRDELTSLQRDKARAKREDPARDAAVVAFLREQADQGSLRAKFELGVRLTEGRGVEEDPILGMALIERAAKDGHTEAADFLRQLEPTKTEAQP